MFENMAYDDFKAALNPKAQGSWNLHEVHRTDMDFFVLQSSATGILGNAAKPTTPPATPTKTPSQNTESPKAC